MNKLNTLLLVSSISCSFVISTSSTPKKNNSEIINCMIEELQEMDNLMEKTYEHSAEMIRSLGKMMNESLEESDERVPTKKALPRVVLTIQDVNQKELKISCNGISADTIKTNPVNKNLLSIKTPNTDILIKVKNNMLSIRAEQEEKNEIEKKDEGASMHSYQCNTAHLKQSIEHPVNLEATTVDYNKDQKTLVVTIPFIKQTTQDQIVK